MPETKNEHLTVKSPILNMSTNSSGGGGGSNQQRNSPKEKRSFTFFRTRTLSNSSNESASNSGGGGGVFANSTSPRLSPRSIFDKVRKRSQSDAKAQPPIVDQVSSNSGSNSNVSKINPQQLSQQQILEQLIRKSNQTNGPGGGGELANSSSMGHVGPGRPGSGRKHLSHSISEENDEAIHNELNNNNNDFISYGKGAVYDSMESSMSMSYSSSRTRHSICLDMDNGFETIENNQIFAYFMKHKYCYDIMPKSAKIVVFDTQLLVKKAFFALIYNGVRSAPLWDSKNKKFVGMLTITDFILILHKYYREANAKIEELEEHRIETWREELKDYRRTFVFLRPEDTLFSAVSALAKNRVHRLPIIDPHTGNVICIVTHKRILRYLYLFIYDMPQPQFLTQSIGDLNIGTYNNINTIKTTTPIIDALNLFVTCKVSALPVVDDNQRLVNIYSKFDVIDLAAEKTYDNLHISVTQALEYRSKRFDGVASCTKNETLETIMERIVNKEVHRLVVVDAENRVTGIVSLSDILTFIILKQVEQQPPAAAQTLTQAFGLTRLSSQTDQSMSEQQQPPQPPTFYSGSTARLGSSSGSSAAATTTTAAILHQPSATIVTSRNVTPPFATPTTINQPQIGSNSIENAIFEDDPMETETVK